MLNNCKFKFNFFYQFNTRCDLLTFIQIPLSVISIGNCAFRGCFSLGEIENDFEKSV